MEEGYLFADVMADPIIDLPKGSISCVKLQDTDILTVSRFVSHGPS